MRRTVRKERMVWSKTIRDWTVRVREVSELMDPRRGSITVPTRDRSTFRDELRVVETLTGSGVSEGSISPSPSSAH